ncbi:MAG: hypothetical protein L3J71_03580 [Victivallaceae bacterium]|nr:hypothetical protein [Victivallaceae bacterium]
MSTSPSVHQSRRQRNNITRLSAAIRTRICMLLDDGAEYDDIRDDAEVAAECTERHLKLHGTTFLAYKSSDEYAGYVEANRQWRHDLDRRRMMAALVTAEHGTADIAAIADYEIMNICIDKLQAGGDLDEKELSAISRAVAAFNRNKLAAAKENESRAAAEREAGYQSQIAELSALVARQAEQLTGTKKTGLSQEALENIEQATGLL